MATKVHMEALSPTMEEGQLVRWLKNEGDQIKEGDVLAEVETDKATMELVARGSGVLRARMLDEGGTAPVGQVIAVIAAPEEDIAALTGGSGAKAPAKPKEAKAEAKEETKRESKPAETRVQHENASAPETEKPKIDRRAEPREGRESQDREYQEQRRQEQTAATAAPARERAAGERVKASPLARRMAAESGVELAGVAGSGPGGRIIRRDIEGAATAGDGNGARRAAPARTGADTEEVPVSQMRKTIAKRLVTSIGPVPTFYLTVDLDVTQLVQARERINARLKDSGVKASINDFVIKAVAAALARHPEVNAAWGDTHITRHHRVHIGVAVAVEDGLITPVIRDADQKGVAEISTEVRELAGRAREKKLKPEEYTGATFSISNLGMFGIDEFTAIINPPEAAILAIGAVTESVVAENGQAVVRPRMRMTMSCDHRVVDGATGARFLQTLRGFIEEPLMFVM